MALPKFAPTAHQTELLTKAAGLAAQARASTDQSKDDLEKRNAAILELADSGVPQQAIATATGLTPARLYVILGGRDRTKAAGTARPAPKKKPAARGKAKGKGRGTKGPKR